MSAIKHSLHLIRRCILYRNEVYGWVLGWEKIQNVKFMIGAYQSRSLKKQDEINAHLLSELFSHRKAILYLMRKGGNWIIEGHYLGDAFEEIIQAELIQTQPDLVTIFQFMKTRFPDEVDWN